MEKRYVSISGALTEVKFLSTSFDENMPNAKGSSKLAIVVYVHYTISFPHYW